MADAKAYATLRRKASASSLAGSLPTAPGFSKPFVQRSSVPASTADWRTGKLKQKPTTGASLSLMLLRSPTWAAQQQNEHPADLQRTRFSGHDLLD